MLQGGYTPTHLAAQSGRLAVLEMLCEHAPATLEAKTNVRLGVSSHFVLTTVLGRQYGSTPLHRAASSRHPTVVVWITERVPYQVLEQDNIGEWCMCV